MKMLSRVITFFKKKPSAGELFNVALLYFHREQYQDALLAYSKAIEFDPKNAIFYKNRGDTYARLGYQAILKSHTLYLSTIREWDKIRPDYLNACNLGDNNYKLAIDDFSKALELAPKYSEAYQELGKIRLLIHPDDPKRAIEDFNKAIELDPKDAYSYFHRGCAFAWISSKLAIEDFNKAIELNPEFTMDPMFYYNRARSFSSIGDHKMAFADFDRVVALRPKDKEAYRNRGDAYNQMGWHVQAFWDYDTIIELNPKDAEAYQYRGNAYEKLGDHKRAIEDFSKAIELNPNDAEAYSLRSISYEKLGDKERWLEDVKKWAEIAKQTKWKPSIEATQEIKDYLNEYKK